MGISIDYLCELIRGTVKLSEEHDSFVWASFDNLDQMKVGDWIKEVAFLAKQETTRKNNV